MGYYNNGSATEIIIRFDEGYENYTATQKFTFYNNDNILAIFKEEYATTDNRVQTKYSLYCKKTSTSVNQIYKVEYTLQNIDGDVVLHNYHNTTIKFTSGSDLTSDIIASHISPSTDLSYTFKSHLPIFDNTDDLFK